jgi:hypothetical protein
VSSRNRENMAETHPVAPRPQLARSQRDDLMRTSLLILGVGATAAVIATALSIRRSGGAPIDPEPETRKFVKIVSKYPDLAAFVSRRLDRTRAGGLLLTAGFVGVFVVAIWIGAVLDMIDDGSGFARLDSVIAD